MRLHNPFVNVFDSGNKQAMRRKSLFERVRRTSFSVHYIHSILADASDPMRIASVQLDGTISTLHALVTNLHVPIHMLSQKKLPYEIFMRQMLAKAREGGLIFDTYSQAVEQRRWQKQQRQQQQQQQQ